MSGNRDGRVAVRLATEDDAATIARLVAAHAAYEGAPEQCRATAEDIRREGFGARPLFEVLLAERAGRTLGFAMFLEVFSSWEGRSILFLEDLYVDEAARGLGVGRRLLARLAAIARARGCPRLDWLVAADNPARAFYHRLGGTHLGDWRFYRLHGAPLAALAAEGEAASSDPDDS